MAKVSAGLVLRSDEVEVFEFRRGLGGVRLSGLKASPIHGTGEQDVAQAIRSALEGAGIKAAALGICVPAEDVLLRSFTLPLLPRAEWDAAVAFEARKYVPFKTEELLWGYHARERKSAKQIHVAFVGIRAEAFARIERCLSEVGLKPSFVEAQAVSLSRLAGRMKEDEDENQFIGIVEVQAKTAHIVIAKDQVPYFARHVNLEPKRPVSAAESPSAAVGPGQIEQVQMGQESPSASLPAVDPRAEILLSELRLSFDFFTQETPHAVIPRLLLFGNPQTIGPWVDWLTSQLGCSVALASLPPQASKFGDEAIEHACAVGFALRGLAPGSVKLDLFARRAAQSLAPKGAMAGLSENLLRGLDPQLARSLIKPAAKQAAVAALALALAWGFWNHRLFKLRQQLNQEIGGFADVGWGLKDQNHKELESRKEQADKQLAFLRQTMNKRVSLTEKLDALAKSLPQSVWLERINYRDSLEIGGPGQMSLTLQGACFLPGAADGLPVISDFFQRIKQEEGFFKGFTSAQLGEVAQAEDSRQRYSYRTFRLNCHSGREVF